MATARKNLTKTSGNTGYSGNTCQTVSQNNRLDHIRGVATALKAVATLDTTVADVATVATCIKQVATPTRLLKGESEQWITRPVATAASVATENQLARENSDQASVVQRWLAGMASFEGSFPPCPGFSPDKWLRVRQAAARFLDEFGEKAAAFGWGDLDLFGVHPEVGIVRGDCSGALMLSNGHRVVAVSEKTIAYEDNLIFYRKPLRGPSVVIWQFKGGPNG